MKNFFVALLFFQPLISAAEGVGFGFMESIRFYKANASQKKNLDFDYDTSLKQETEAFDLMIKKLGRTKNTAEYVQHIDSLIAGELKAEGGQKYVKSMGPNNLISIKILASELLNASEDYMDFADKAGAVYKLFKTKYPQLMQGFVDRLRSNAGWEIVGLCKNEIGPIIRKDRITENEYREVWSQFYKANLAMIRFCEKMEVTKDVQVEISTLCKEEYPNELLGMTGNLTDYIKDDPKCNKAFKAFMQTEVRLDSKISFFERKAESLSGLKIMTLEEVVIAFEENRKKERAAEKAAK